MCEEILKNNPSLFKYANDIAKKISKEKE